MATPAAPAAAALSLLPLSIGPRWLVELALLGLGVEEGPVAIALPRQGIGRDRRGGGQQLPLRPTASAAGSGRQGPFGVGPSGRRGKAGAPAPVLALLAPCCLLLGKLGAEAGVKLGGCGCLQQEGAGQSGARCSTAAQQELLWQSLRLQLSAQQQHKAPSFADE